jgi:hypothetical protein
MLCKRVHTRAESISIAGSGLEAISESECPFAIIARADNPTPGITSRCEYAGMLHERHVNAVKATTAIFLKFTVIFVSFG